MSSLHWLIVIPFYFFTALLVFFVLAITCRVLRARVGANPLAITAAVTALVATVVPAALGWLPLEAYTSMRMVALAVGSFVLAVLDMLLMPTLGLPLDDELRDA